MIRRSETATQVRIRLINDGVAVRLFVVVLNVATIGEEARGRIAGIGPSRGPRDAPLEVLPQLAARILRSSRLTIPS